MTPSSQSDSPPQSDSPDRRSASHRQLKSLLRDVHGGLPADLAKLRFDEAIRDISPREIGEVEEELIREGTPVAEIQKLCDLHVSTVRTALDEREEIRVPPGHPVHTYMEENRRLSELADRLGELSHRLAENATATNSRRGSAAPDEELLAAFVGTLDELDPIHLHYLRKEHELFPAMERHGIAGPPKVMWSVHDDVRQQLKGTRVSLETLRTSGANLEIEDEEVRDSLMIRTRDALSRRGAKLARAISEMIYKENKILFPMALRALSRGEWASIRRGEDELGYAFDGPAARFPAQPTHGAGTRGTLPVLSAEPVRATAAPTTLPVLPAAVAELEGRDPAVQPPAAQASAVQPPAIQPSPAQPSEAHLELGTGQLTLQQVDLMLRHLPIDLSFVDADGFVRYYSETPERLFPRTPGAIGRHVENCHPPKSLPVVREILRAFAAGERDVAEFWMESGDKFIHIRYFAVRDSERRYAGCLEVTQDVSGIRGLEGQRRLLEWG